ncbi:MAG: hypothetical protein Q9166_004894 [cf. Caloplaca sp. 2 TL-2023]
MDNTTDWPDQALAPLPAAQDMQTGWEGAQRSRVTSSTNAYQIPTLVCLWPGCAYFTPSQDDLNSHYASHFESMIGLPKQNQGAISNEPSSGPASETTDANDKLSLHHIIFDIVEPHRELVIDASPGLIRQFLLSRPPKRIDRDNSAEYASIRHVLLHDDGAQATIYYYSGPFKPVRIGLIKLRLKPRIAPAKPVQKMGRFETPYLNLSLLEGNKVLLQLPRLQPKR